MSDWNPETRESETTSHRLSWRIGLLVVVVLAGLPAIVGRGDADVPEPGPAPESNPPLALETTDPGLQNGLDAAIHELGVRRLVRNRRLAVALADLSRPDTIPYAGVNDDVMMYAASLPKIAVLLAAFEGIERGTIVESPSLRRTLTEMIRYSDNEAATRAIHRVGYDEIARCLQQPHYRLYDRNGAGGLWVGKAYSPEPAVMRDPLHGISHGATARQAARFFVLLDRGRLVSPERSREMLHILGEPGIRHKFVKGLESRPGARIHRKSGSWRGWHSDAALIERAGHRYVAAALVHDTKGGRILERLIVELDDLIAADRAPANRSPEPARTLPEDVEAQNLQ